MSCHQEQNATRLFLTFVAVAVGFDGYFRSWIFQCSQETVTKVWSIRRGSYYTEPLKREVFLGLLTTK